MKDKLLKISYIFTAFVVVGVVLFHSLTAPVMAANEITSLPMIDVEVECTYDDEYVYMNHKGLLYPLKRSQFVSRVYPDSGLDYRTFLINYTVDGPKYNNISGYQDYVPEYTDMESTGLMAPLSMWFSEKEMRVYMFTGTNTTLNDIGERGKIKSYYGSSFIFDTCGSFVALNYYDLSDMSFHTLGLISLQGNPQKLHGVYPDMYVGGTGGINSYIDESGKSTLFPNDLVCIYSNYEISGYFEFGGEDGSIYAPKYYFDYQYIFYVEDVGYTFIDSARPLVGIVDNKDGYAYLDFSETCNRRVWTSPDGISWSYANLASAMLGDLLQMPYKWFFDNVGGSMIAKLVYTTDLDYDENPIIKPEYGDIFDIIDDLHNSDLDFIVDNNLPDIDVEGDSDNLWFLIPKALSDYFGFDYSFIGIDDGISFSEFVDMYLFGALTSEYMPVYNPETGAYKYDVLTVIGALNGIYQNTYDNNLLLSNMQLNLHNDLKAVFDNISLSNHYLESLDSTLAALPDYSKKLDDILLALDNLEVKVPASGVTTVLVDLSELQEYLLMIDDTSEIQALLQELDKSIDNVAQIEAVDELTDFFDFVDEEGDEAERGLADLFKEILDPEDRDVINELGTFISGAVSSITYGGILAGSFDKLAQSSDGFGWINAKVEGMYAVSGNLQPIFLIGVSLLCVNLVVRRNV